MPGHEVDRRLEGAPLFGARMAPERHEGFAAFHARMNPNRYSRPSADERVTLHIEEQIARIRRRQPRESLARRRIQRLDPILAVDALGPL